VSPTYPSWRRSTDVTLSTLSLPMAFENVTEYDAAGTLQA
jgi:hypothetical protein